MTTLDTYARQLMADDPEALACYDRITAAVLANRESLAFLSPLTDDEIRAAAPALIDALTAIVMQAQAAGDMRRLAQVRWFIDAAQDDAASKAVH